MGAETHATERLASQGAQLNNFYLQVVDKIVLKKKFFFLFFFCYKMNFVIPSSFFYLRKQR